MPTDPSTTESDKRVVVLAPHPRKISEIFTDEDLERLHQMAHVVWAKDDPIPPAEMAKVRERAYAIVMARWQNIAVAEFPSLRAILEVSGRHPSPSLLDYETCFARGIRVLSCAPAFGPMVAEMALGMALAASRQIVAGHVGFLDGSERYLHEGNLDTFTLYDKPVGLIGFGGLARALRPLLAPFRCPIQVYDPWVAPTYLRDQGVIPLSLEELLATSRVIFVLAIPSVENKSLLDREMLKLIPADAVLVLMSRAHVVDFDALTEMLYAGRFRAAIDVFPEEPLPADHPIRHAPGVVLSAHRAGSVGPELRRIGHLVVNDLEAMLAGLPPLEMQVAQPEIVGRLP
jgi:phosphoglycerate dehydrogenase-like enzyme